MMDRAKFFDYFRGRTDVLGPTLDAGEVQGCDAIMDAMAGAPLSHCAYALATAYHETAHEMQPIKEYGGPKYFTKMYDITGVRPKLAWANGNVNPGDGVKYCGRGYVQLTWRNNYRRLGEFIGQPLEGNPDMAMRPDIAARIMREGMDRGLFTGKRFTDYLPPSRLATANSYRDARRIINGMDKAALIAGYAVQFQEALDKAGWT
jgi:putative chitinase